jgi:outer membrane protein assembly factor BamB
MRTGNCKNLWRLAACVAGIFVLLVGGTMVLSDVRIRQNDPLKSARLKKFKDELRLNPTDENLKKQIRQFDLELRTQYFRHMGGKDSGVYLLLGGSALILVAMNRASTRTPRLPDQTRDDSSHSGFVSRWVVGATGASIGAVLLMIGFKAKTTVPRRTANVETLLGAETSPANRIVDGDASLSKRNWNGFRGPEGNGAASATNIPANWDAATGNGIVWKIANPASGYNSPIVWENRLFFSGATDKECSVYAFDSDTGQKLWNHSVAAEALKAAASAIPVSSRANATMIADGERAYAFFGSGDLVSFSKEGKPIWQKTLGPLNNQYGHAASLMIWKRRLILQLDQGEAEAGKSRLYAFDSRTGQIVWQRARRVGSSWATPIIADAAGKAQIITLGVPWVIAYSAEDGSELWQVEGLNGEVTPSPIFSAGLVFALSPSEKLFAIQPDGSGDVTKTKIAWSTEENVPDITSPVCDGKLLFTLTSSGVLTCFNAANGKKQWDHDFAMEFHSSPSIAAGRLYLFGRKGTAIVAEAAAEFKEILRTEMPDAFAASPAFADGRIFIRGETNVWCIGSTPQKMAAQ